ncbi:hypothetical protein [Paenibacillus fonticola]|uniref:hypothetical protein n=1 Tax=Paenibacillus fonticola TaxID=379896 RepID=UPI0003769703|nr:hypothetical protein [Paenibacillus fonticola]
MEAYVEVMRRTVELSETCIEGLQYVSIRLDEGMMEETLYLLEDIVYGFCQIVNSTQLLDSCIIDDHFSVITNSIEKSLDDIVSAYESNNLYLASNEINHRLLPFFQSWNNELAYVFKNYILS